MSCDIQINVHTGFHDRCYIVKASRSSYLELVCNTVYTEKNGSEDIASKYIIFHCYDDMERVANAMLKVCEISKAFNKKNETVTA